MLEKIGLPTKPSLRGNTWVVDASHCQGCSSQFTFINRKHHCRRCGGLFCNGCTSQRMLLRGQGDSPVRICDPCKKLEEAARFELRHGHRNRAGKGSSRSVLKNEDEVLAQILSSDMKGSSSSRSSFPSQADSSLDRTESGSDFTEESSTSAPNEMVSSTPDELRQQALDEKKKYRVLKGEGKPEEALKAFKRGKDLERQADALEIYLRKSRKKAALPAGSIGEHPNPNLTGDDGTKPHLKNRSRGGSNARKDDLTSELKELGWSEMDLQNEEKKSGNMTVEGELSALIGEVSGKTDVSKGNQGIYRTEIAAHKRKAVSLKKDGKLAEAKEELKKAKLLERQAEEQELVAGAEDSSDDEFSDLIRSMDESKQENFSSARGHNQFDGLLSVGDIENIGTDPNFEVTEEDLEDPDLTSTLKSLGWEEDADQTEDLAATSRFSREDQTPRVYKESSSSAVQGSSRAVVQKPRRSKAQIQRELLGLKRKALTLRREGKAEEAEETLKAAKELEDEISELDAMKNNPTRIETPVKSPVEEVNEEEVTENDLRDPTLLVMLEDLGWKDEEQHAIKVQEQFSHSTGPDPSKATSQSLSRGAARVPRSKAKIQRELLGLKRKALELRRKGETEEAEKVLREAKVVEAEMEELEGGPKEHQPDDPEEKRAETVKSAAANDSIKNAVEVIEKPIDTFQSIGSTTTSMQELSGPSNRTQGSASVDKVDLLTANDDRRIPPVLNQNPADRMGSSDPHPLGHSSDQNSSAKSSPEKVTITEKRPQVTEAAQRSAYQKTLSPLKQEILEHKKKAVALKKEGRMAEAMEELKRAKLLEKSLDEEKPHAQPSVPAASSSSVPSVQEERDPPAPAPAPKPLSGRERFKIQQESLGHKRQAMKLRREGRIQEAEAEFELAKALEAQLEEPGTSDSGKSSLEGAGDVVVEDLLDPELLSALRAIGIEGTSKRSPDKPKPEPVRVDAGRSDSSSSLSKERTKLEEEIRAAKVKAVTLKKSGRQAEALEALRHAKLLEKKLNALPSQ